MPTPILVDAPVLRAALLVAFDRAGFKDSTAQAAVKAMMHASTLGVDSHGARLIGFYRDMLERRAVNPDPRLSRRRTAAATGIVDGDRGLGHGATYEAMAFAVEIARESGVGAVGVVRSNHFGAAGAYALAAAEAGMIGLATANAESLVTLFGGAEAFHGTNPLAVAAPVEGAKPWLLDMATSSIPWNRVLLYRSLGRGLPPGVGADAAGAATEDATAAKMLMPVGGADFGFKGAALAGVATLLSAILQGMSADHELLGEARHVVPGATPESGHFVLAIDPGRFVGREAFAAGMRAYLTALRAVPPAQGAAPVMAPGDREWAVEAERARVGIPIDPDTARLLGLTPA